MPLVANEVLLTHKQAAGKINFISIHFDHRGKIAREEAAKIIKTRVNDF